MATADARAIVEHLAQPPWSRDLSILELSQLPPPQLLQLLVAALSKVHPKGEDQVRPPRRVPPARAAGRLTRGRARPGARGRRGGHGQVRGGLPALLQVQVPRPPVSAPPSSS